MKQFDKERILPGILGEYISLGKELGLFEKGSIDSIQSRISNVKVVEDYTLPGDARTIFEEGKAKLIINPGRCHQGHKDYFMDEVIFHELSHLINEIQRDLYVYESHQIMRFSKENATGNNLLDYPEWGMILLDESIAQYTAQLMVERKYGRKIYDEEFFKTTLTEPEVVLSTKLSDYPEAYKFAYSFARTIYSNGDPMFRLCKDAFNHSLLDQIFTKYKKRENGISDLHDILGFMGNIMMADYARKGFFTVSNTEENRDKKYVLHSMHEVLHRTNKIIEKEKEN